MSAVEPVPGFQSKIDPVSANPTRSSGHGVPDVAGNADPATGYRIYVDGRSMVVGGTGAVSPLWAGLTALLQQQTGRIAPLLPACTLPRRRSVTSPTVPTARTMTLRVGTPAPAWAPRWATCSARRSACLTPPELARSEQRWAGAARVPTSPKPVKAADRRGAARRWTRGRSASRAPVAGGGGRRPAAGSAPRRRARAD